MSTKQDNDVENNYALDISSSINDGQQTTNNNGDEKSQKQAKTRWNNSYKKFDKKKRDEVILWCKLVMFIVSACICVASFTIPLLRNARPRGIAMWQWSLLITVLLGGPLLSKGILQLVRQFLDRDFSVKENVIYYVLGLVESAWVVLWFTMVLIAWLLVVDEPRYLGMAYDNKSEKIIKKFATTYPIINVTLITLIMGSFLWLLKDLVLMKAKSSFHIRRFFDRIYQALMYQYVINGFSSVIESQNGKLIAISSGIENKSLWRRVKSWFIKEKKSKIVDISCFDDVTQADVSCWGMKQLIDWMMLNEHLTYKYIDNNLQGITNTKYIETLDDANRAADFIFESLFYGKNIPECYIGDKELEEYFPTDERRLRKRVKECLHKGAGAQYIVKEVFKKWMVKAYRERSSLVRALMANKGLFRSLNIFINVLLVFLIFALWLIMIRVETRRVIFVVATAIAGSAFVFGDTCKKILENLLFVFLVHPFDIGDCCFIDNTMVIIEEISVLSTTALTLDHEIRHYSNATIANQPISNYTRSTHMGDVIEFALDTHTIETKIDNLKVKIDRYIKDNEHFWSNEHHWVFEFEDQGKMKAKLHFLHTINYHDFKEKEIRKSKLVLEVNKILNELNKPPAPVKEEWKISHM